MVILDMPIHQTFSAFTSNHANLQNRSGQNQFEYKFGIVCSCVITYANAFANYVNYDQNMGELEVNDVAPRFAFNRNKFHFP